MTPDKTWRKSTRSAPQNACVELAVHPTTVAIRDSKSPGTGELTLPRPTFTTFLTTLNT